MPVTEFQRSVLAILVRLRGPGSHFAGSPPLHISGDSARYSHDFDIFHDAESELDRASEADVATLEAAGFSVERLGAWKGSNTFRKARVRGADADSTLEIDWAFDSAVRFFPIVPDAELGWKLHPFDLATNKALALSARSVTRDVIDIVEWGRRVPLSAIVWAACGKDPGFNPLMLLMFMRRFTRVYPDQIKELAAREIDPVALKREWIEMAVVAEEQILALADAQPDLPIGVVFANADNEPTWPRDPEVALEAQGLRVHHPTVGGCWPRIAGLE